LGVRRRETADKQDNRVSAALGPKHAGSEAKKVPSNQKQGSLLLKAEEDLLTKEQEYNPTPNHHRDSDPRRSLAQSAEFQ
jgi:hypothetical protein